MSDSTAASEQNTKPSHQASWSLGLAIGGLCCLGPIAALPAIVLGHIARSSIRKSNGLLRGKNIALAGLITAYTSLVIHILLFTALLFSNQITDRLQTLSHPPDYTFNISISDPTCSSTKIKHILSERLHDIKVPHTIRALSPGTLQIELATQTGRLSIDEAKSLITAPGVLEFRLVHTHSDQWVRELFASRKAPPGYSIPDAANANFYTRNLTFERNPNDLATFDFREKSELMLQKDTLSDESTVYRPMYVEFSNQLAGTSLTDASPQYNMNNWPYISLSFDSAGAERFATVTTENVNRRLAIIVDGTLYSAPMITEPIRGGYAQITGIFSFNEALTLTALMRVDPLPCALEIISEGDLTP